MTRYNSIYDIALEIAKNLGVSIRSDVFDQFDSVYAITKEIAKAKGVAVQPFDSTYSIIKSIALVDGLREPSYGWNSTFDILQAIANQYGVETFNSNYDAALFILDNMEQPEPVYIDVLIDGQTVQVNQLATYARNGYTNLYTANAYNRESEVVSVAYNFPAVGDSFYTSYVIKQIQVMIDGSMVYVDKDKTYGQNGYSHIYTANEYMTEADVVSVVNKLPKAGDNFYTSYDILTVNVSIDGTIQPLNKKETYYAQGYNELYLNDEYESEADVERVNTRTTYPKVGDVLYTSYLLIKQWMKQAAATYNIPVMNIYNANENYRFVDYLKNVAGNSVMPLDNVGSDSSGYLITAKRDSYSADTIVMGSRPSTSTNSRFVFGATSNLYVGWNATYSLNTPQIGEKQVGKINYLNNRILECGGTTRAVPQTLASQNNNKIVLFGYNRAGTPAVGGQSWYVYNLVFTQGTSFESVYIPAINANGTAIMLDLKTMKEFENQGSEALITGSEMSLEDKFSELLVSSQSVMTLNLDEE